MDPSLWSLSTGCPSSDSLHGPRSCYAYNSTSAARPLTNPKRQRGCPRWRFGLVCDLQYESAAANPPKNLADLPPLVPFYRRRAAHRPEATPMRTTPLPTLLRYLFRVTGT